LDHTCVESESVTEGLGKLLPEEGDVVGQCEQSIMGEVARSVAAFHVSEKGLKPVGYCAKWRGMEPPDRVSGAIH
jgi:hypothetical protein